MCGEKSCRRCGVVSTEGSPPRVRGKDEFLQRLILAAGITPACAGKSWKVLICLPIDGDHPRVCGKSRNGETDQKDERDHPRVCGEKGAVAPGRRARAGSPPRVRGKEQQGGRACRRGGITPACAGKSIFLYPLYSGCKDHPRVCGEKQVESKSIYLK